jgi:dTDP-4-amino-4,6-dideoxygalactose transaminase
MVADYCGTKHAVAVSSGTAALHLSLLALGIGPGDEVICPSLSFIATANSIRLAGATPVFADIDPRTYNLDPAAVEAAITERTKAIMVVHQIGLPADIDRFNELGRKYGVKVLEDAACALGSRYKGVPIGGHTEVACFSFHPRKVITTGEGGMVTTNNADYAEQIRLLRQHGMRVVPSLEANAAASASKEEYLCVAYNYRMTDIQAAIGIEQMKKLDRILKQRRELAAKYDDALHVSDHLESPFVPSYAEPNYQSYAVQLIADLADSRDRLIQQLHRSGISVRTGITLAHLACPYRDSATTDLPNSCDASRRSILLPLYPSMTANEQDGVVAAVRALIPSIVYAVG